MNFAPKALALAASLTVLSGLAQATVVANNPWDATATDPGAFSQQNQQLASQFSLGSASSINGASWHGTMFSADPLNTGDTWNFSIRFYADVAGSVGGLLNTVAVTAAVTDTGVDTASERDYIFDASFGDVALGSGSYFLSIVNTGNQNTFRWTRGIGSGAAAYSGDGIFWNALNAASRVPPNFTLLSTGQEVPEPGTLALVGAALLALQWRRRA